MSDLTREELEQERQAYKERRKAKAEETIRSLQRLRTRTKPYTEFYVGKFDPNKFRD